MHVLKRFIRYWIPPLCYMALIFLMSHQPKPFIRPPQFRFADKVFHGFAYFLLGVLVARLLLKDGKMRKTAVLITAGIITSLYGASDEYHQSMVAGRFADVFDWMADTVGGILGIIVFLRLNRYDTTTGRSENQ